MFDQESMRRWRRGMALMMLGLTFFWGAVILLAFLAIIKLSGMWHGALARSSPLNIARRRFARGAISQEQFEQIRQDLSR